jgi:hypothetical protein
MGTLSKWLLQLVAPIVIGAVVAVATMLVIDRLTVNQWAADRNVLLQRKAELVTRTLEPGSPLACLDGAIGETIETACEAAIFASPQSTAAAVAYTAERLSLVADAHDFSKRAGAAFAVGFPNIQRAVSLDRFGLAAHVLATRDGCTSRSCDAFAWLSDVTTLKNNLNMQVFNQYVTRHAEAWNRPADKPAAVSEVSSVPPEAAAAAASVPMVASHGPATTLARKYDFPSAASIPPVSIMNAEPKLPKEAAAAATPAPVSAGAAPEIDPPLPPRRPPPPHAVQPAAAAPAPATATPAQ